MTETFFIYAFSTVTFCTYTSLIGRFFASLTFTDSDVLRDIRTFLFIRDVRLTNPVCVCVCVCDVWACVLTVCGLCVVSACDVHTQLNESI